MKIRFGSWMESALNAFMKVLFLLLRYHASFHSMPAVYGVYMSVSRYIISLPKSSILTGEGHSSFLLKINEVILTLMIQDNVPYCS